MSRSKKSRKNNENGAKLAPRSKQNDRQLSVKKQNSGNKSGSRHNANLVEISGKGAGVAKDPRHGSKKAVALTLPKKAAPKVKKQQEPKLSDEQLLLKLEDDPRLNQLLDQLEEGKVLAADDQQWLESQLKKIESLMERLGITEEDDLNQVMTSTVAATDDDLLNRFESGSDLLKDYQTKD